MRKFRTALYASVWCSTQPKYWIPVLEIYWSIITSMAFEIILVQYQYSIEILKYFWVSLSVFQKEIKGPKFEYFIVLKRCHFRKCIIINFFMSIVKFPTSNAKLFTLLSKTHAIFYDAIKGQATSNNSCQLEV